MKRSLISVVFLLLLATSLCLLTSCGERYRSVADLANKRLCVLSASIFDQAFAVYFPSATKVVVPTMPGLPQAILAGQCDAGFVGESQGQGILAQSPEIDIVQDSIQEWASSIAFGFSQADTTNLLGNFNTFLRVISKNGMLEQIVQGWRRMPDSMPTPEMPTQGRRTVRVGTAAEEPPVTFRRGEAFAGIDMDLTARFAKSENLAVQVKVYPFDQLIPALVAGELDVVANQFSITPERIKFVNFSAPYMYEPVMVIAAKKHVARK
jgi:ABC-type amino acid transport substrate-binding protein